MDSEQENTIGMNNRSWRDAWKASGNDTLFSDNDMALFEMTGVCTRALSDLDEVRNDPALTGAKKEAGKIVTDFKSRAEKLEANEKFIAEVLSETVENRNMLEEIKKIKLEINEKQINELTADWVKEWHENRQKGAAKEEKKKEIRNFITSSLETEEPYENYNLKTSGRDEDEIINKKDKKPVRKLSVKYISFSAAAAIALLFVIKSLLPSAGPDKLYDKYYRPFNIVSPVTRNATEGKNLLGEAINKYKSGDFRSASATFSAIADADTTLVAPRFYFAMSEMAAGKYKEAITLLTSVVAKGGQYSKEADWYLGLAYLKNGDTKKARDCFISLSESPGFYSERSGKLLRRLK